MLSQAAHAHLDEALTCTIAAGCHTVTVALDNIEHIDNAYVQTLRSPQKRLRRGI